MAAPCPPARQGQRLSHLRSIGSRAPLPSSSSDVIHFFKAVTLFGRNSEVVDYYLSSSADTTTDLKYISRIHARVIQTPSEYVLVDSSLTGMYVNDVRISGRVVLQEGDTVTFGHPAGKNLLPGSHTRQPNSPFYFLFEHCHCRIDQMRSIYGHRTNLPQELKCPALVSAGVSHPGPLSVAFTHSISHPLMALPRHTPLTIPSASAPCLVSPPLPMPSQDTASGAAGTSSQAGLSAPSFSPRRAPRRPTSQVLRSASPEYTVPGKDSFAAAKSSPFRESSEPTDPISLSGRCGSAVECVVPDSHPLLQHEYASSDPERARVPPLLPGPTRSEVSVSADHGGAQSENPATASGPREATLQLSPIFQAETGGTPDRTPPPAFRAETPALSDTDEDEETTEMNLCQSAEEETACRWASCASEADTVEEMEELGAAGSSARAAGGCMDGGQKPSPKGSTEEADGVESRAVSLPGMGQALPPPGLGHFEHDSADRTAGVFSSSGVEPMDDSPAEILSQDQLDSERSGAVLPSRNSPRGTQSAGVGCEVHSQQNSDDVEVGPPVDAGLGGVDCRVRGRELACLEPELGSAIPAVAEGICHRASAVEVSAEVRIGTGGVKPGEMEAAVTGPLQDVDASEISSDDGIDSRAHVAKEMLPEKLSEILVIDEQFKGKSFEEAKKGFIEASGTMQESLPSKDLSETFEEGRGPLTDLLKTSPGFVPVEALEMFVPKPPRHLGEQVLEKDLFESTKVLFESQVAEGAAMEEKLEPENPGGAESNQSSSDAVDCGLRVLEGLRQSGLASLGVACVSTGVQPNDRRGRQHQGDSEELPGEEELEVERRITSTAAATSEDGDDQQQEEESQLFVAQEKANYSDASLSESLSVNPAGWSSLDLAESEGDSSGDGLEEGRASHLGGTQPPPQKSQNEAGERAGPAHDHLLSFQCATEEEGCASLKEEDTVKTKVGEEEEEAARANPAANVPLTETKRDSEQMGSLNDHWKPCGTCSCAVKQPKCLLCVGLEELESDRAEPESQEKDLEVRSQGPEDGGKLLFLEDFPIQDGASEEACRPEAAAEQAGPPLPEECGQDTAFPEESGGSSQLAESSPCSAESGSPLRSLPSLGTLQPGNVALNLPRDTQDDPVEAPELPAGREPRLHRWASEAEKGGRGRVSSSKTGGFDPVEHVLHVSENSEAFRGETEESTVPRPRDLVAQGAAVGPRKGTETLKANLGGQSSSQQDQGSPARAAADAETPSLSARSRPVASEALEETGLEPFKLASPSAKTPYESAEGPRMEEGPYSCCDGSIAKAGRDCATASPLGEAVEEHPGGETSASPRSGKEDYARNAGVAGLVPLPGDVKMLPRQVGNGRVSSLGCRGGLGYSEPPKTLWQEEEELNGSSPGKRALSQEEERVDWEDYPCCQKKLCLVNFVSDQGSAGDPAAPPAALPPPADLRNNFDQFGKMMERFLDRYRNQVPLCSDSAKRNGDRIADIVRSYFKSDFCSNEPATANDQTEMLAPPSEGAVAEDVDGQREGGAGEARGSVGRGGPGSPNVQEEGVQIPEDPRLSPAGRPAWSGSSIQEQGDDSAGSVQEASYSEEEPFPLRGGSAWEDSSSRFPPASQKAVDTEVALEEDVDALSSWDITSTSDGHEPSPGAHRRASGGLLEGGARETSGTASEAGAEWESSSDADWWDEGSRTPPDAAMSCQEGSQAPPRVAQAEGVCLPALPPSGQGAPGLWLTRGEREGGDAAVEASSREDPGRAGSMNEKSPAGDPRRGGSLLLQSSPAVGSPGQGSTESTSAVGEPFRHSPWESSSRTGLRSRGGHPDPPLKTELPYDCHDGGTDVSASAVASAPGGGRPKGPARCTPSPVEGSAKDKEAGSPLPALSSSQARVAADAGKRGSDPEEGWHWHWPGRGAGHAGSQQASQEAPRTPDFSPATSVCSDEGPCSCLPMQRDGSDLAQSPLGDMLAHSQVSRREEDLGKSEDQLCPHSSYPTACSPLSRHPHVPRAPADPQPGRPTNLADFGGGDPWLPFWFKEAGLEEPSDLECLLVAAAVLCPAAPEFEESDSILRDRPAPRESQSSGFCERAENDSLAGWASSEQDVAFQLQECQLVLGEILQSLSSVEGIDSAHVEKWRDQISALQKATKMPQTYIAVVGNTGAGKSCLLNALLDEEAVLPTSAMRACTAVVVEISRAAEGHPYEADVEFLSREEWDKELQELLEDMKDRAGVLRKRCPDRKTEAGAAYSRVKAVYGRVEELEKLEERQEVTQHLGTVKRICADTAADFRMNIEKFIDSRTDSLREMKGGEFWPIVKCVRIRVAKSEVLKTGAVLVDLPGIRDSNAARDATAREYLKDCNAVWVTASITRAVDDKTARELLSANFRRQLFMDGLYGSLAFICTKTDSFNISDIVRDLHLQDEIRPLEDELRDLENQKTQAEVEKKRLYSQLQQEPRGEGSAAADPVWLQRHDILEKEFRISALQREKEAKLRAISLICVQARNEFSKQRIRTDFSAGLEEVSRRALYPECEDDGEEEMEDGDSAGMQPRDLQVFTVSSTEYLKLGGKLLCSGQPQVFHDLKDTEIPALKKFAMDTALKHSMATAEKVIRDVARVLSQMVNYLTSQRAEDDAHQAQVQEILQQALRHLPPLLQEALSGSLQDIGHYFRGLLLASLQNGAEKAKQLAESVVKSWGSPVFGYPHSTYRAICNHHGVYTSPRYQCVDFNKHLAEPIYQVLSVPWSEVFGSKLVSSIESFTQALLGRLRSFFKDLRKKLHQHRQAEEAVRTIYGQQMEAARARVFNFTLDQMNCITRKQRVISRLLIPEIQASMEPAYAVCCQFSGPGYFQRMKGMMEEFVHKQKETIFDSLVEKLRQQLDLLQQSIQSSFQKLARELVASVSMQFEPMLQPVQKNKKILPELLHICAKVDKLCKRSGVDYVLPSSMQPEPRTEAKLLRNGESVSFPAASIDVRVGAISLPRISAIEVSKEEIMLTLADGTASVALPLRRVSHCEFCLPLGCLILYISAKAAQQICFQCRIPISSPGLCSQEALVIREGTQDQRQLPQLLACLSARHSAMQSLSLQQAKEKLVSLGASCPAQEVEGSQSFSPPWTKPVAEQTPMVPPVASAPEPIPAVATAEQQPQCPSGRKRAGEAAQLQPEKKSKVHATGPAGCPLPQCSGNAEVKPTSGTVALQESCSPKGASLPHGPPFPMALNRDGETLALPASAGFLCVVGAKKGIGGKPPNINMKEEEGSRPL